MCFGLVCDVKYVKCMCKGNYGGGVIFVLLLIVM